MRVPPGPAAVLALALAATLAAPWAGAASVNPGTWLVLEGLPSGAWNARLVAPPAPLEALEACATVPTAGTCKGLLGWRHTPPNAFLLAGAAASLLQPGWASVAATLPANGGSRNFTCAFAPQGGMAGVFPLPPGAVTCGFTPGSIPAIPTPGSWRLEGAQSPGLGGTIVHAIR